MNEDDDNMSEDDDNVENKDDDNEVENKKMARRRLCVFGVISGTQQPSSLS